MTDAGMIIDGEVFIKVTPRCDECNEPLDGVGMFLCLDCNEKVKQEFNNLIGIHTDDKNHLHL